MARLLESLGLKHKDTAEEVLHSQRELTHATESLAERVRELAEAVITTRDDPSGNIIQDMARGQYRHRRTDRDVG